MEEDLIKKKPGLGGPAKSKIAIAIGKLPADPLKDSDDDEEDYSSESSEEEVSAMKLFMKASDPEGKARALKLFLEACGAV